MSSPPHGAEDALTWRCGFHFPAFSSSGGSSRLRREWSTLKRDHSHQTRQNRVWLLFLTVADRADSLSRQNSPFGLQKVKEINAAYLSGSANHSNAISGYLENVVVDLSESSV